ncbi:Nucleolar complex-associated protein 3 [Fonsecaea pedrosoi]|nr:Nucleolar complex-associated protein 3 [Fonsecaea pedrosoi]
MPHGRPVKRRRLSPPVDDSKSSETIKASDLFVRAADWDLEQEYEKKSRQKKAKESTRLPIKTAEGRLQRIEEKVPIENEDDSDSFLGSGTDGEDEEGDTPPSETEPTVPQVPLKQQIVAAKEEIARIAGLLNEDPEEHAGSFKKLAQVCSPTSPIAVQKLVLAAQTAVYKDVIPGYRIRSYKDEELGNKISKDVRRTRQYEHALVTGYQAYVKQLGSLAKARKGDAEIQSLRSVAINCACTLLLSVPHFNFRTEILGILVHEVASRESSPDFIKCVETFEEFFSHDEDGAPSLEAVNLLSKMMKAKDYRVREEVLNTFFHLRLLSELPPPGSNDKSDRPELPSKLHGRKVKQQTSQHMTKRERKLLKQRREVEKDMAEASALVNHEEREKIQSESLKMVFVTYFRILKARVPELMGAVLEGLAKYAHLINQDLFGDLLEALKEIVSAADEAVRGELDMDGVEAERTATNLDREAIRNRKREGLLATQTAFTLLSGQEVSKAASNLHLDLSFFTAHTYRSLYPLSLEADIELGPKSLRLPDPHSSKSAASAEKNRINISTPILLLTRVLTSILLTPSSPPPTQTVLSFFKRLLTVSLQLPEKSAMAVLGLMAKIADKHGRKIEALWYSDERKGDGVYRGDSESVEGTNALGTGSGVWEAELLRRHYCPKIRESVQRMEGGIRNLHR